MSIDLSEFEQATDSRGPRGFLDIAVEFMDEEQYAKFLAALGLPDGRRRHTYGAVAAVVNRWAEQGGWLIPGDITSEMVSRWEKARRG